MATHCSEGNDFRAGGVLNICAANARQRVATAAASARPAALAAPERSSLLARATAFLPQLAAANAQLATTQGAEDSIHVEEASNAVDNVGDKSADEGGPRIEMDLACGVLELQDAAARAAAEAAAARAGSEASSFDSDSDEEAQAEAPKMVQELCQRSVATGNDGGADAHGDGACDVDAGQAPAKERNGGDGQKT